MIIVKVDNKNSIEKALKQYKSKVIKTRQMSELNDRKTFVKDSVKKRKELQKAKYVQKKFKSNLD
jgi:small subunit ribosomal protein S21